MTETERFRKLATDIVQQLVEHAEQLRDVPTREALHDCLDVLSPFDKPRR